MNGHAKGCICQDCTIGREIGMDRALELIREMQDALSISDEAFMVDGHDPLFGGLIDKAGELLAEHE